MRLQFFSANTIEQALMAAGRHFGLDPDRVAYRLRDKKHGFLNIRRRVVIEVDPAAPEKPEAPPRPEPVAAAPRPAGARETAPGIIRGPSTRGPSIRRDERPPARPRRDRRDDGPPRHDRRGDGPWDDGPPVREAREEESVWSLGQKVRDEFAATAEAAEGRGEDREVAAFEKAVEEIIALLGLRLEGSARRTDDGFVVEVTGEDRDFLVEDEGRVLRAIEHLLPRLVRGLLGRGLPCRVDSEGFQAARESELQELAGGMAELARRQGTPQTLEPMNPADRRTVHMALADDPTVRTRSEGDGFMKRVGIVPVEDAGAE